MEVVQVTKVMFVIQNLNTKLNSPDKDRNIFTASALLHAKSLYVKEPLNAVSTLTPAHPHLLRTRAERGESSLG